MKILKKIIIPLLVTIIILTNQTVWALDKILDETANIKRENNKILSAWHIDTNLNQVFYKENGIHIEGWKLATEANSKIVISIDGKKISEECIKY